jgi:polyisoprenoid-binding protein YceI
MASVNSGNTIRDQHVHGDEFFAVAGYQQMTFRSTSITDADSGYEMAGDLTIKGVTQPVVLQVAYNGSNVFPMDQSTRYGFAATGTISRSAFGVSAGETMVSDDVNLRLDVQFVSPAAG